MDLTSYLDSTSYGSVQHRACQRFDARTTFTLRGDTPDRFARRYVIHCCLIPTATGIQPDRLLERPNQPSQKVYDEKYQDYLAGSAKSSRFTLATNSLHLSQLRVISVPPVSVDLRTSTCSPCVAISTHAPPSHRLPMRHMGSPVDPQSTTSPTEIGTPVHLPTQHGLSGDVNLPETDMLLLRPNTLRLRNKLLPSCM